MPRLPCLLLLGVVAWVAALTLAAPPAPPPPQPPPPPPPQLPPSALVAPPGTCEKLAPCDLYSQLQEHSRRIAGFSYNVKKADAALTALARQQAAAAVRTDRLAHALTQLEISLDGLSSAPAAAPGEAAPGAPSAPAATTHAPAMAAPAPAGDWEQAAARELARLGDRLSRLREQVNATFVRTLRENSEELATMRGRVASLNTQVADLAAAARGETVGRRVVAQGESRPLTAASTSAPAPSPANTTAAAAAATTTTATSTSTESHAAAALAVASEGASPPMAQQTPAPNVSSGGDPVAQEVVPTVASELSTSTVAPLVTNTSSADSSSGVGSDREQPSETTGTNETQSSVDPPIGVTSNQGEVSEPINGNGSGNNGNGESVDSLGIELETVRTAFDTLHAQVTDLQARCDSRGEELEAMVATLERRLAGLETPKPSPPQSSNSSDLNIPLNSNVSVNAANNNNTDGMLDGTTNATLVQQHQQHPTHEENVTETVRSEVKLQTPQISIHIEGLTEIIREDSDAVRTEATTSSTVPPTTTPTVSPESNNRK